ncbi:MFS transporter [soil metagenome]
MADAVESPLARPVSRPAGFSLMAASMLAIMAAAAVPTPLYVVYQDDWGFSSVTLTLIYGVYVIPLLIALLTVGGVSDYIGRRKVLVVSYSILALSMVAFILADSVEGLMIARLLQGLATGSAMGAVASGLLDLAPLRRPNLGPLLNSIGPTIGLATGAAVSGLLVQLAPAPTTTIFAVVGVIFVVLAIWAWFLPETKIARPGALASLRPRLGVPKPARRTFFVVVPAIVASAGLGGFYNAIAPSVAADVLHQDNHFVAGLAVTTLQVTATISALVGVRILTTRHMVVAGSFGIVAGAGLVIVSMPAHSIVLFFLGTAFAGFGYGVQYLGAVRTVAPLSPLGQRAELFSTLNVVNYLSMSIPAVLAGALIHQIGLMAAGATYMAAMMTLAVVAAILKPPVAPVPASSAAAATAHMIPSDG